MPKDLLNPTEIKITMLPLLQRAKVDYTVMEVKEETVIITADKSKFGNVFRKVKVYSNTPALLKELGLHENLYHITADYAVIPKAIADKMEVSADKKSIGISDADKLEIKAVIDHLNSHVQANTELSSATAKSAIGEISTNNLVFEKNSRKFACVPPCTYRTMDVLEEPDMVLASGAIGKCAVVIIQGPKNITTMAHFFPDTAYIQDIAAMNLKRVFEGHLKRGGSLQDPSSRITVMGSAQGFEGVPTSKLIALTLQDTHYFPKLEPLVEQKRIIFLEQTVIDLTSDALLRNHYFYASRNGICAAKSGSTMVFKEDSNLDDRLLANFSDVIAEESPGLDRNLKELSKKIESKSERQQSMDPEGTKTCMTMVESLKLWRELSLEPGEGLGY